MITDILWMSKEVSRARHLVPRELGGSETLLARLEDRAIGGLYQLAFSRGNNSAAPSRPPNIAQFMRHDTDVPWFPFYFSWYRLDLTDRTFRDISLEKTCHYHTHSLAKMKNVKEALDGNFDLFAKSPTGQGWRLYEAIDRLFAGFSEPMGIAESSNAIWQFWLAERSKYSPPVGCPRCTDENGNVVACDGDDTVREYYRQIW